MSDKDEDETNEERGARPKIEKDYIEVQLTTKDLGQLIILLNVAKNTFDTLAINAVQLDNLEATDMFKARAEMTKIYSDFLNTYLVIGEPESREIH